MKKKLFIAGLLSFAFLSSRALMLHNDYAYLQDITFEMYSDDVPAYKVPEQLKSIEETLMFEVLHATWKDKHWVAYTLNKNLLGTYKVGQPALLDNGDTKKIYFVAAFPGSLGGLDLYVAEYKNGAWGKPRNLGKGINTEKNESNPGLLNEHTLTYSSGGIIKKLDLNTLEVVNLEEAGVGENPPAFPKSSPAAPQEAVKPEPAQPAPPAPAAIPEKPAVPAPVAAQETAPVAPKPQPAPVAAPLPVSPAKGIQFLGSKSREEMMSTYRSAIQLGAFTSPKWESFEPFSKYGKVVSFKNEKNMNVVWITGFASRAAAEAVLPAVKATAGFENAYVTGK